ncbi:MAG TPA: spore germination protein GerW family protein [Thermoanaerobaculia bacterium]|nr:spore germination protein GerW family protein [Thermoanaerobaculia bacterium]
MSDANFIQRIAESIQIHANARQVYGDPVERDGTTIIPVARVQWGFGGGGIGRGAAERGGGGGGARAYPAGFIHLRNGEAEFRPIHDASVVALAAVGIGGLIAGLALAKILRR